MLGDRLPARALVASAVLHGVLAVTLAVRLQAAPRSSDFGDDWSGTFEIDAVTLSAPTTTIQTVPASAPASEAPSEALSPAPTAASEAMEASIERALPRRVTPPKPTSGSEPEQPASEEGEAPSETARGALNQGAANMQPGVRDLAKAFTRAIPFATRADPIWLRLPLGEAGSMRVTISVDAEGRIAEGKASERDEPLPLQLKHLLERTLFLLKNGQFAVSGERVQEGTQVLRIEALLRSVSADDTYADSQYAMSLDFEPPTLRRPGKAAFQLGTGRRLEVTVHIERVSTPRGSEP
jgi:hypothetical protein